MIKEMKNRVLFWVMTILSFIIITILCIYTGMISIGLEGDEVFSYISSTSLGGFYEICFLKDQTWYDGSYFYNSLAATGMERFNISMVFENQAMDTHPPLFYVFLNIVCSIFPGVYSKWFGIGLNIFFLILVELGLFLLLNFF